MWEFDNLLTNIDNGVVTISINREEKLNALNVATVKELRSAIQMVYDSEDVKGVIITGVGSKAFVAGADIEEIAQLNELNGRKFAENGQEVFQMIESCPKPIIAAVNGYALGGGCELAMACHLRVATSSAKLGQPEVNLGILPGYGGTQRLTYLIGRSRALELMMTADIITAQKALEFGLVNHLTESQDDLVPKCREILEKILSKAPLAVGMVINCVNAAYDPEQRGYQTEANSFANCCKSTDFKEGTIAFLEKRTPNFQGE